MGCLLWLYQFLGFLLLFHLHFLATCSSSSLQLCPHDQSIALLQFKNSLSIDSDASSDCEDNGITSYPKTDSWKEGTDCCSWDGVTCDSLTGHVIGLDLSCSRLSDPISPNSSLFQLPHLKSLNLASNCFNGSKIPPQFGWFASLTHLNLSNSCFSGQVPSQFSHLSRLISLDLTSYWSSLRLKTPTLKWIVDNLTEVRELFLDEIDMSSVAPSSLMNLSSSLTSLSLRSCQLGGNFPSNIFYQPKLQSLRLSSNSNLSVYFPKSNWSCPLEFLDVSNLFFSGDLLHSIGNLQSLKFLSLLGCHLITESISSSLKNLRQLTNLDLSYNNLSGALPEPIFYLESLKSLHMLGCHFTGSIPFSLKSLKQLTHLDLSENNFTGPIPDIFGNLNKLAFLNLGTNNFGGQLPSSLFNLSQLESIDISSNQLVGSIPYQAGKLPNLINLALHDNLLNGAIPSWLYTLPSLQYMRLYNNKLTGHINEVLSKSLVEIQLENNKLHGPLPSSIFELVSLTDLYLSSNNLSGNVESDMFSKLKNLQFLDLSYNSLSFIGPNLHVNYTLPHLQELSFSFCKMSEIPNFVRATKNMQRLDLSNNKIGNIPKWMWDVGLDSLYYLNLSHNFLTSVQALPWRNIQILDLHSNSLQGPVPMPPLHWLRFFSISQNKLTAEIPSLICNASSLEILDFSHNNLSGILPRCIGNFSERLSMLNLRMNNFHGSIPTVFSKSCGLRNLNFYGNRLDGSVPQTLVNCRNLEVLDLGNNKIDDKFPYWLGSLAELQILVLRSNKFHGFVHGFKANHSKLQIFDLSNNDFEGPLPAEYIKNLNAMMGVTEGKSDLKYMGEKNYLYDYSVTVTIKNFDIEMEKIFTFFTSIDLSKNRFEGGIPQVIGKLGSLKGLNLSHNNLGGHIPPTIGNLINLEWLDLSSNKLFGKIPEQLADVTSLEVLNLSCNQLVGSIPLGRQFNTFNNDSYEGNLGLCGFPLTKTCGNIEPQQPPQSILHEDDDAESAFEFGWKVVLMGYGCGMVIGLAMGYLVFRTGKPKWFVMLVEGEHHLKAKRSKNNARKSGGRRN